MTTLRRLTIPRNFVEESASEDGGSTFSHCVGRLIQVGLALWLLPALVVVMAVSGIGMVTLATARTFTRSASQPPETERIKSCEEERSANPGSETPVLGQAKQQGISATVDRVTHRERHCV